MYYFCISSTQTPNFPKGSQFTYPWCVNWSRVVILSFQKLSTPVSRPSQFSSFLCWTILIYWRVSDGILFDEKTVRSTSLAFGKLSLFSAQEMEGYSFFGKIFEHAGFWDNMKYEGRRVTNEEQHWFARRSDFAWLHTFSKTIGVVKAKVRTRVRLVDCVTYLSQITFYVQIDVLSSDIVVVEDIM